MAATIRPLQADDHDPLVRVLDATGLFPGEMLAEMAAPNLSGSANDLWIVAEGDGGVTGFCYAVPEEMAAGAWNMLALAVHPDHHGRGLGRALVAGAEQRLTAAGARIVVVDTSGTADFAAARAFYAAVGYEEEARIRDFWADGDDKVTFRKRLAR